MMRRTVLPAVVVVCACCGASSSGQEQEKDDDVRELLRQMSARIEALERTHQEDQKRIRELEERLGRIEGSPADHDREAEVQAIKEEIKSELAEQQRPGLLDLSSADYGAGNALNPQITVFLDTGGSISSDGDNKALNRFNLREMEVDFRAAISPTVDGVLIIALHEEIESERNGDVDIDRNVELEEGYLDFHTLPYDLAMKVGKFRNSFGRNNLLHTHDLPQVTRPLAVRSFFGSEGLNTTGVSLGWLVPNPWDKYIEARLELVNADGGHESPILGGPNADNPAVLGHIKFFDDVTDTSSFEIGGTYLFGHTGDDPDFDANVFGLDLAYHWTDPDPSRFRSFLVQGELFWSHNDVNRGPFDSRRIDAFGAYAFAQYQLDQNWYVGIRGDYAEFPNSETRGPSDHDVALSPSVTWYINEFLRARLQYEHRWFDFDDGSGQEDAVFLQFTGVFGSHPPHPYWVRR